VRTRIGVAAAVTVALVATVVAWVSSPAGAAATTAGQVITVSAPSATSTTATVEAWARQADGRYKRVANFPGARIGSRGMGPASEGLSRTPVGRFKLTQPFGIKPNPGVSTSYFKVDANDVWTGSTGSVINQHRRCAAGTCPASYGALERLSQYPGAYDYGVFIGYNAPAPYGSGAVRGAGSAFFLHVKGSAATAGCVAVSAAELVWLLRWLRSAAGPTIALGVGKNAYNPIPRRYT